MEALEEGNVDEEELEDLDEKLEMDYQIGEDLKERVRFYDLFFADLLPHMYADQSLLKRSFQEPSTTLPARHWSTTTKWKSSMTSLTRMTLMRK